jgi:hypothetical protein
MIAVSGFGPDPSLLTLPGPDLEQVEVDERGRQSQEVPGGRDNLIKHFFSHKLVDTEHNVSFRDSSFSTSVGRQLPSKLEDCLPTHV